MEFSEKLYIWENIKESCLYRYKGHEQDLNCININDWQKLSELIFEESENRCNEESDFLCESTLCRELVCPTTEIMTICSEDDSWLSIIDIVVMNSQLIDAFFSDTHYTHVKIEFADSIIGIINCIDGILAFHVHSKDLDKLINICMEMRND